MAAPLPPTGPQYDANSLYIIVKGLENKVNNLLRQMEIFKNDYIKKNTDLKKEVKALADGLIELKQDRDATVQKMDMIIKELRQTAGIEQVSVLKRYIDLWNPMNFATQRDVERMVEIKLAEAHGHGHEHSHTVTKHEKGDE